LEIPIFSELQAGEREISDPFADFESGLEGNTPHGL